MGKSAAGEGRMAYLKTLRKACLESGCPKDATVELVSNRNDSHGQYCKTHGDKHLLDLQKSEQVNEQGR